MRTTMQPGYTYTGITVPVNAIAGTVVEGRGTIRKGDAYRSPARQNVIQNRKDGVLTSYTILDSDGRRVCKVGPDARIL